MKSLIFNIMLILFPTMIFSQGWFENNPIWTNKMLGSTIIDGIQTLTIVGPNCAPDTLELYEKGIITINGTDLRYQKLLRSQDNDNTSLVNIIEKIGYYEDENIDFNGISTTTYPFAYLNMALNFDCISSEPPPHPICFENENFGFMYTNVECDGTIIINSENLSTKEKIKVFPVPFDDKIFIEESTSFRIRSYELYDLAGNVLLKKYLKNNQSKTITIDLPSYSKGVYFIRILFSNGEYFTSKLIK